VHVEDLPSTLLLDAEGRFLHEGTVISHPRLLALLHRSIVRCDDMTFVVTTGRDRVPLTVTDTPYFVRTLERTDAGQTALVLSDATREMVNEETEFLIDASNRLRVRVKSARFFAKLLRPAHTAIIDSLSHDERGTVARPLDGPAVRVVAADRGIDWRR
jgi:hypothetical protein